VSWAASSAHCSSGLAAKRRAAPPRACRAEQGEARNAGPRRVLQPHWEIRDRSFEQQRYRATVKPSMTACLQYLSPLGWGAHQPDRRLPLAQQRQDRRRAVQAIRPLQPAKRALFIEMVLPPSVPMLRTGFPFGELSWKTLRSLVSIW
jgi:hypothetical protein